MNMIGIIWIYTITTTTRALWACLSQSHSGADVDQTRHQRYPSCRAHAQTTHYTIVRYAPSCLMTAIGVLSFLEAESKSAQQRGQVQSNLHAHNAYHALLSIQNT
jgi:hypothetical protein